MRLLQVRILFLGISCVTAMYSGPVGVDGLLGSEWNGITPVHIANGPNYCNSCFGTPAPETSGPTYDIYVRGDADYFYALVSAGSPVSLLFSNLYFDLNPVTSPGSDFGVEILNNNGFIPATGASHLLTGYLTYASDAGTGGIEMSLPWSFFLTDPLAFGYPVLPNNKITMRLSQTFSYDVSGGSTFGTDRLGSVTYTPQAVPEPATAGLAGLFLAGLFGANSTLRERISRAFSRR